MPRSSGRGRIDAPGRYDVLYLSDAAAGAVAEGFGRLTPWSELMLRVPGMPGAARVVARYALADRAPVLDLDDAAALSALGIRPSEVVTRDRSVTQSWARRAFETKRWAGVRWWSYYDPRWYAYGLWDRRDLTVVGVEKLSLEHPAVVEAATILRRPRGFG